MGRVCGQVHGHAGRGVGIGQTRQHRTLAVGGTGDGIVAAPAFEFVETDLRAGRAGVAGEARCVKRVCQIAADDALDADQGVVADPAPLAVPAARLIVTLPVASRYTARSKPSPPSS